MNAVIYARYSSDNQREESIEGQLRECREYAEKNGLTIITTYIDRALSAKTANRPEFQKLIKDSGKKLFEVVLVWKLDRFARNRYDSAHYKTMLRKNGVKVVSAKEAIAQDSTGILLESLLEGYAEFYSVELSEKVRRGRTENALKGKHNGGYFPMGYKGDSEQHFAIDPRFAPIVQEIFQRYADGETVIDITNSLNERGLLSATGNAFNKNTVHRILRNRKYIGEFKFGDIVHPDGMPAIISKELFDKVQIRLQRNKTAPAMKKAAMDYLLTTKLFCGKCGAYMVGESGTSKTSKIHYYYKCVSVRLKRGCDKKTVKKDWIERLVVEETKNLILNDTTIDKMADDVIIYQKRENTTLPLLKQQLSEAEKNIANLLDAIQQGILTPSTKQRLEELEAKKEKLGISIAQEQIQKPMLSKEQVVFFFSRFKDGDIDDPQYRKYIIDIFVNAVYLYEDKMLLVCNYKDGTKTVTFDVVQGSDLTSLAPPKKPVN